MEPRPDHKAAFREDDGLQVDYTRLPQTSMTAPDHEGLQYSEHTDPSTSGSYAEMHFRKHEPGPIPMVGPTKPQKSRKKLFVVIGVVVGILVILAAVLGGVFGSRATRQAADGDRNGDPASMTADDAPDTKLTQAVGRIRSTKGVWNGTAIASSWILSTSNTNGIALYQDYTGAIMQQSWKWDKPSASLSFDFPPVNTQLKAGNGTGLSLSCYGASAVCHLVYICPNGTLADAFVSINSSTFTRDGAFGGRWTDGNLTAYKWTAPLDTRPALLLRTDQRWYGREFNKWGARLWVGTADGNTKGGRLLQRSFDFPSRSWDSGPPLVLQGGSAYGGVQIQKGDLDRSSSNTTLYTTAPDGTLQYQVQIYRNNQTQWPHGPQFLNVVEAPVKAAPNSSIFTHWPTQTERNLFFPDAAGLLNRVALRPDKNGTDVWGATGQTANRTTLMSGTAIDQEDPTGDSGLETGDTLSWMSLWGQMTQRQGKMVPKS